MGGGGGTLFSLSYVSQATQRDPAALRVEAALIAAASAALNAAAGVTGALAVGDGWFAQVIEGPRLAVLDTFDRILRDRRHTEIRLLAFHPIAQRRFAAWSMGFAGELAPGLLQGAAVEHARQEGGGASDIVQRGQAIILALAARVGPA
jgi:hypothetical protein